MKPDVVFPVDTFVSADSPIETGRLGASRLGNGAVIRAVDHSNVTPRGAVRRVIGIAERREIPLQYGATGGGNDGSVFVSVGAVDVPIAWPLRYSHSPAEVADLDDYRALARLIVALAEGY